MVALSQLAVTASFDNQVSAGADAAAKSLEAAADGFERVDTAVKRASPSFEVVNRKLDENARLTAAVERSAKQHEAQLVTLQAALDRGAITQEDYNEKARRSSVVMDNSVAAARRQADAMRESFGRVANDSEKAAGAIKLQSYQVQNLTAQAVDFAVQVGSGQGIFRPLLQQGPQAVDAIGGVRNAIALATAAINPWAVALGVAALATGGLVIMADRHDAALRGLSVRLRATRDDYNSMAQAVYDASNKLAASSSLSTTDARAAGQIIGGARDFQGGSAEIASLTRQAADLARVMGTDVPAAATSFIAKAFHEPAALAREMAQTGLFGVTDALRRQIEVLVALGDKQGATNLLLDTFNQRARGAADDVSFLTAAWRGLSNAVTDAWKGFDEWLTRQARAARRGGAGVSAGDFTETWGDAMFSPGGGAGRGGASLGIGGTPAPSRQPSAAGYTLAPELAALRSGNFTTADVEAAIRAQAVRMNVDPSFAAAIASAESGFQATNRSGGVLTSPAGALGIMQLMPGTAATYGANPRDPVENIIGGLLHIQALQADRNFRTPDGSVDLSLVAAGYNAGGGRAGQYVTQGRGLPAETLAYVNRVMARTGDAGDGFTAAGLGPTATRLAAVNDNFQGQDTRSDQIRLRTAQETQLQGMLSSPGLDEEAQTRVAQLLQKVRQELVSLRDPLSEANRLQDQQIALFGRTAGAARDLAAAEQRGREEADKGGRSAAEVTVNGLMARQREQLRLTGALNDTIEAMGRQTSADKATAAAAAQGEEAAQRATATQRAQIEALKFGAAGSDEYRDALSRLTQGYIEAAQAAASLKTGRDIADQGRQIELIQAEAAAVGQNVVARNEELAALRARQNVQKGGGDPTSDLSLTYIQNARDISRATDELQRQRAAFDDVANVGSQAFDRIGTAITTAFAQGKGQAISFGSVTSAIMSELMQAVLKFTVINPVKNALFGQNNPTGSDVFSALGNAGGGASASGTGGGSWISGLLGSTLWGNTSRQANNQAIANMGTGADGAALYGPATPSAVSAVGTGPTLGGFVGGVGLGVGVGSMAGNLAAGGNSYRQQNAMTGAAVGALSGAVIGSIIPGVGTMIGGAVGGLVGGVGGGMLGPSHSFSGGGVDFFIGPDGKLAIGATGGKRWDAQGAMSASQQIVDQVNAQMAAAGIRFGGSGKAGSYNVGDAGPSTYVGALAYQSRNLMSDDPNTQIALNTLGGRGGLDEAVKSAQWVQQTYDPLIKAARASDAFTRSLEAIHDQYDTAITKAAQLGLAEGELASARDKAIDTLTKERDLNVRAISSGLTVRELRNGGNSQQADLTAFDTQAAQETYNLKKQLLDLGQTDAYVSSEMIRLEKVQTDERLAIQKNYVDAAIAQEEARAQTANGTIASLVNYAHGLRYGGGSTLTPEQKLAEASQQFDAVSSSAIAGNYGSLQQIQSYSDALLSASRDVNGSGTGYVNDFNRVIEVLDKLSSVSADTLTASVMQQETRTQTEILNASLQALRDEVIALRREVAQGNAAPARLAAA